MASPSTTARCAAQISGSSGARRRRVARMSADVGEILGLDEQLGEGRMGDVGGLRRQRQFGIGGDLDLARAGAGVGDRDAADLGIVLGRDEHVQRRRQRAVAARELGAILGEARRRSRRARRRSADSPPTRPRRCRRRAGRCRSRSRRRWRPRASASRRGRPSGCSRSRRPSAWWCSGRSTAGAWPASPGAREEKRRPPDGLDVAHLCAATSLRPPRAGRPRRRAACAPAAAARSPGRSARRGSARASRRRAGRWRWRRSSCPGDAP